jgi:RimJ/RimL family protein N-acetyltransferase
MTPLQIFTPRLVLRTPMPEDTAIVHQAKEEMWPVLQLWMSWSHDDQKTLAATEEYLAASRAKSPYENLLAFRRDNGAFAISTGICATDDPGVFGTGYWAAKPQLGQGFATEATNAIIRYAFGALKAKTLLIDHYEGNEKSRNVILKLGFRPTMVLPKHHKRCLDGTPLDVHKFKRTDAAGLPPLEVT